MDVDLMTSSSPPPSSTGDHHQEHMDMMTMMMQMEKQLPDLMINSCHDQPPFHNTTTPNTTSSTSTLQEMQLISSNNATSPVQNIYQNPHAPSPPLINPTLNCSSLPFMTTSPLQQEPIVVPLQPNMVTTTKFNKHAPPPPLYNNPTTSSFLSSVEKKNSTAAIREMIFRIAAMQPIHIDPESIKPPKRRNVKISKDPQSVAARHRRERISERIRILQRLVPGGTKMDTASMLDEAIHYVKFLKKQVQSLEQAGANRPPIGGLMGFSSSSTSDGLAMPSMGYFPLVKNCLPHVGSNMVGASMQMLR